MLARLPLQPQFSVAWATQGILKIGAKVRLELWNYCGVVELWNYLQRPQHADPSPAITGVVFTLVVALVKLAAKLKVIWDALRKREDDICRFLYFAVTNKCIDWSCGVCYWDRFILVPIVQSDVLTQHALHGTSIASSHVEFFWCVLLIGCGLSFSRSPVSLKPHIRLASWIPTVRSWLVTVSFRLRKRSNVEVSNPYLNQWLQGFCRRMELEIGIEYLGIDKRTWLRNDGWERGFAPQDAEQWSQEGADKEWNACAKVRETPKKSRMGRTFRAEWWLQFLFWKKRFPLAAMLKGRKKVMDHLCRHRRLAKVECTLVQFTVCLQNAWQREIKPWWTQRYCAPEIRRTEMKPWSYQSQLQTQDRTNQALVVWKCQWLRTMSRIPHMFGTTEVKVKNGCQSYWIEKRKNRQERSFPKFPKNKQFWNGPRTQEIDSRKGTQIPWKSNSQGWDPSTQKKKSLWWRNIMRKRRTSWRKSGGIRMKWKEYKNFLENRKVAWWHQT